MGSGKSQASIDFMNSHPDRRFVYITPYLDEADRIIKSCPKLHFEAPSYKNNETKTEHTSELLVKGLNVASTHNAFKNYSCEMLESIRDKKYTLFIDENMDILDSCDVAEADIELLVSGGYIRYDEESKVYVITDKQYTGKKFTDVMWLFRSRQIIGVDTVERPTGRKVKLFFWTLPKELITSFEDVYILTYMLKGQSFYYFLELNHLNYKYIGVTPDDVPSGYRFTGEPMPLPEYARHLRDLIEVLDNKALNSIGSRRTSLSKEWFRRNKTSRAEKLKNNTYNVFNHIWGSECTSDNRMWSTFKTYRDTVKGKGYTKGYTTVNLRATNNFRNKTHLVYDCNIFMNVEHKMFYAAFGIEADDDLFALSTMVQWIWRSAIREGHPIKIYIPSERMRNLLTGWMDSLAEGGGADEREAV